MASWLACVDISATQYKGSKVNLIVSLQHGVVLRSIRFLYDG